MNRCPKYFFILGAAKCGTTSLFYYLDQHPDILMSTPKETLYFEKEYTKGSKIFLAKYYPNYNGEAFLGEARHRNLYLPYIPERVAESFPDARLIVILRNPVDRAYSHYLHHKNRGMEPLSFKDALTDNIKRIEKGIMFKSKNDIKNYIDQLTSDGANKIYRIYLDCGYYAEQIERYLQFFSKDQIHIMFTEDLKKDVSGSYHNLLKFIDNKLDLVDIDYSVQNPRTNRLNIIFSKTLSRYPQLKSRIPKWVKQASYDITGKLYNNEQDMDNDIRAWLISHYKEHNRRLEKLTSRDLSHWSKS